MPICKKLLLAGLFFALFSPALLSPDEICLAQSPTKVEESKRASQDIQKDSWLNFQTAYFTVFYKPEVNLKRVLGKLSSRSLPSYSNPPTYTLTGIEAKVAYRLDLIFMRVRDILGMHPDKTEIKIKIYKNRRNITVELNYLNQEDKACKSFYVYRFNTIYASEQDMSDSVIAHEMAHAVVDNYFSTTPPEKMAEILATNVDIHLDD